MKSFSEIREIEKKFHDLQYDYWLHHDLFQWQWWFLLIMTIIPWIAWWKLVDKRKLVEILLFGLIVMIIAIFFDLIVSNHMLWGYPHRIHWSLHPILLPYDITFIPVIYMIIYQRYPNWINFTIGMVLLSAVFSWIAEPLLEWMGLYQKYTWKAIYSFPNYIWIGLLTKWLVILIFNINRQKNDG